MTEYNFELRYKVPDSSTDASDRYVEALAENGCTDALVGQGRPGYLSLTFDRESPNATAAILSAMHDVREAIPDAELVEAAPDLVGLSEMADILGRSRQYMRKLLIDGFKLAPPAPAVANKIPLWHFAECLHWMSNVKETKIQPGMVEAADVIQFVNAKMAANKARKIDSPSTQAISELLAHQPAA